MRKTILLIFIIFSTAITVDAQKKGEGHVSRYMSPGDPNLNPNWDWTVNGSGHTIYYSTSGQTPTPLYNVQLPFFTQGHTLNTYEKDMHQQDGWVLAFRDVGTASSAPAIPFFVLYNKYRGVFRVMCYNSPNINTNFFRMELSFWDPNKSGALFTFNEEIKVFNNDYDKFNIESAMGTAATYRGWLYTDFTMFGFDPNLHADSRLRLKFYEIDESQISLNSTTFTLSEVVDEATPTANRLTGSDIIGAVNKGHKYYKSVSKAKKSIKDKVDKTSGNPWWKSPANDLITGAIGTVAPYMGALMGFVTSFIGGKDKQSAREPMKFEGALELQGTMNSVTKSFDIDFALSPGSQMADTYRPLHTIEWGVFNLDNKPVVDAHTEIDEYYNDYWQECEYSEVTDFVLDKSTFNYSFNTQAGMTLSSIKIAYTYSNKQPTSYYNLITQSVATYSYDAPGYRTPDPTGIAVELTLSINSPTLYSDDEIVVYKVYPFTRNSSYEYIGSCDPYNYRMAIPKEDIPVWQVIVAPNPIGATGTKLSFRVQEGGHYMLKIMDTNGREIITLLDEHRNPGTYTIDWSGADASNKQVSSGLYHYLLVCPDKTISGKLVKK
ncbi:MAG: hypothetical protein WBH03_08050 [Cyclobacteriaceae bacterium]